MTDFQQIINSSKPVLVDFFATWCGPCKMMHPILEDVKARVGDDAKIITIDVDRNRQLADQLQIQSVPTLILFKNGQVKYRASGVHRADDLERLLRDNM